MASTTTPAEAPAYPPGQHDTPSATRHDDWVTASGLETPPAAAAETAETEDFLPILGVEYVEYWVGNAYQAAQYYRTHFGFDVVAYAGPETGVRDRASYVLKQGQITFTLTAPLGPGSEIARHVTKHGDGVKDIALRVADVDAAFRETTARVALARWRRRTRSPGPKAPRARRRSPSTATRCIPS